VFFVGPGGAVEEDSYSGGAWHGPAPIGGTATGGIATMGDGSHVFFVGPGGAIENDYYSGGAWRGPYSIGGTGSGPIATMGDGSHVYCCLPLSAALRCSDGVVNPVPRQARQ